jgi:bifunctional non-homologous end joining protein LigD
VVSRHGRVWTEAFPEFVGMGRVISRSAVLDGETIVLGDGGRPSFERLSARLRASSRIGRRVGWSATFVAFDVLELDGHAVTHLRWVDRRAMLEELDVAGTPVVATMVVDDGEALFEATGQLGVEGIVAYLNSRGAVPPARAALRQRSPRTAQHP